MFKTILTSRIFQAISTAAGIFGNVCCVQGLIVGFLDPFAKISKMDY